MTPLEMGTDGSWMLPKALVVEVGLEQGGKFDFFSCWILIKIRLSNSLLAFDVCVFCENKPRPERWLERAREWAYRRLVTCPEHVSEVTVHIHHGLGINSYFRTLTWSQPELLPFVYQRSAPPSSTSSSQQACFPA